MEGKLESCLGKECKVSCCTSKQYLSHFEFNNSKFSANKDSFSKLGIIFEEKQGYVYFSRCYDDDGCKILNFSSEDIRPLKCKIYPYRLLELGGCYDEGTVGIELRSCPATDPNFSVPDSFKKEVISIVKDHYKNIFSRDVEVIEIITTNIC